VDGISNGLVMVGLQAMDLGTTLFTWLRGERVGTDAFGNRYYRNRRLKRYGRERRWVIYKGEVEASKVPAEWHAWLHHMVEEPLTDESRRWPWQKPHVPNLSGTAYAYRPKGHELRGGRRAHATGDYEPWTPE
jgi:NADH:ubiquinone oxidoreductase subunit